MGRDLLHLGFLVTVLQQLACPAEPCGNTSNTSLHAQVGENISMSCPFSVLDPRKAPKVQWNYRSQTNNTENIVYTENINGNESRLYYRPPFEGRTWVNATGLAHGDATLHLAGVTTSDQGNFSCWVGLGHDCVSVEVQLWVSDHHHQSRLALDCGLAATCFSGLVLSLAAAVTLCV
ncbi:junctional adhesion molecule-like [Mauremys mutica]|uniref:junctional adhesion molecule-like n=1 Tax=Mauremys mutica TaxID=74926 RepID=UPI001D16C4FD|nr:junctional adhesion molecule-like [Mauremys mutica]XP_044847348.1 junctional adhesion molecule-like [Mauremys mutica]XP_044847350.1 junctional adhesion molecule-like [Mauremys mutica]XP_044847351.1 junctional adhesion molecule-like [Mauremys mutica]